MTAKEIHFLQMAIELSRCGMQNNKGGPFGAVVVKGEEVVGQGSNMVTATNDPTAHAEVVAIREACKNLNTYQLTDCEIYCSCEPCPMCLGAIYWARPRKVYFANTRHDAASIGFDDAFIYEEIGRPLADRKIPFVRVQLQEAQAVFAYWKEMGNRTLY